jgi:hypothetical protein
MLYQCDYPARFFRWPVLYDLTKCLENIFSLFSPFLHGDVNDNPRPPFQAKDLEAAGIPSSGLKSWDPMETERAPEHAVNPYSVTRRY